MAQGGRIDYTIGFNVDKSGLDKVSFELTKLSQMTKEDFLKINPDLSTLKSAEKKLKEVQSVVKDVQTAYKDAFSSQAGTINIEKLSQSLNNIGLNKIASSFKSLGVQGVQAFNSISRQVLTTNLKFKETNGLLDKMGTTLANTIKWQFSSSLVNRFTGAVSQAYGYVKHLDTSLNDIRIVTGKSADEMERFAEQANKTAQALGKTTTDATEAALIYYQQGLSDEEAQARMETTLKAANVTGQSTAAVSEELTAVWNGYKVATEETEAAVDKLAAVAATTASDLQELSTGMSKVASAANAMGVDMDQLNAQIATIISVTRQAPESVGTALKTIYARLADLKLGDTDEDGLGLGDVSGTLDKVGIAVLDANGDLREMGDVIEDVAAKWNTWTSAQQTAIAEVMAGKRQYNNLVALFENWDMYSSALDTSRNSLGTLQNQQDIYMESTEAHINQLKAEWEDLYDSLLDADSINTLTDAISHLVDLLGKFVDSIGGGKSVLLGLGAVITQVFNRQLSTELSNVIIKMQNAKDNARLLQQEIDKIAFAKNVQEGTEAFDALRRLKEEMIQYHGILSNEEIEDLNIAIGKVADLYAEKDKLVAQEEERLNLVNEEITATETLVHKLAEAQVQSNGSGLKGSGGKAAQNLNIAEGTGIEESKKTLDYADSVIEKNGKIDQTYQQLRSTIESLVKQQKEYAELASKPVHQLDEQEYENFTQILPDSIEKLENKILVLKQELSKLFEQSGIENYEKLVEKTTKAYDNFIEKLKQGKNTNSGGITKSLDSIEQKINEIKASAKEAINQARTGLNELPEQIGEQAREAADEIGEIGNQAQVAENRLRGVFSELDTRKLVSDVSNLVGGISTLAFSFNALTNITKTWGDDTLSTFDKILQSSMSLSMVLPGVKKTIDGLKAATEIWKVANWELAASESAIVTVEGIRLTKESAMIAAETVFNLLTKEEQATLGEETLALIANAGGFDKNTAQIVLNSAAVKENSAAREVLNKSLASGAPELKGLSKGLSGVTKKVLGLAKAHPIAAAAVVAGTVAIGVAVKASLKHQEEHIKKIKEENDAIIERNKKEQESIKNNIDAANSLKEITKEYEKGNLSQREYNDKKAELISNLDQEAQYAFTVAKSYDEATASLDKYIRKETERSKAEAQTSQQSALYNMIQGAGGKGQGAWYTDKNLYENDIGGITSMSDYEAQLIDELSKAGLGEITSNTGGGIIFRLRLDLDDENIIQKFKDYQKIIEDFKWIDDSSIYNQLSSELKQMTNSEYYSQFMTNTNTIQSDELTLTADDIGLSDAVKDNAINKYDEFIEAIKEKQQEGIIDSSQSAYEIASEYISQYGNSALKAANDFEILKTQVQGLYVPTEAFKKQQEALGNDTSWIDKRSDKIEEIFNYLRENNLYDQAKFLNNNDWQEIFESSNWEEDLNTALSERYDDYLKHLKENLAESMGQTSDELKGIIDSGITGDLSATDENYTKMLEKVDQLKEAYPELTGVINDFSTAGLVGSEHWIQAAYQLQEAIDKIEFDNLNAKANEARENLQDMFTKTVGDTPGEMVTIHVTPDDSEFQEAIDNILDAEYAIDVEVHADAERDFTQLVNSLEQADSMADKIGEDFIVAADDIRELNQAFPGILQDIEYLGDGTIKLNEDIARAAMAAAADEEAASTQALVTKLQNSATELRAKADIYDAAADIAAKAAAHEIDSDKAKTDIATELNKVESENDKIASQSEIDNAVLVADNSEVNAQINAENWTKSYQEAARASAQWANAAIQNAAAVARGQGPVNDGGDFGVNATMRNGQASEAAKSGSGYQNASTTQDWKATEEQFRNMAEAARQEANDIEGMIVAAAAKGTESLKKAGEVGKGSGSGGSDSGKEADHEEYLEREEDIYHTINQELEQIESTLGRIQKLEDHSWGASAKANLEEENKLLEKQIEKLHEKKALQERDLSTRRKQLEDVGISFTEDGSAMTNAEAQLNALYAHYNTMVDTYNAMSAAEQETYKAQLEAEKDRIKKIEDKINQYESTYSDYQSVLDEIMDKHFEQIEKQVQTFNHDIELHLELDEAKEEWNDFWYDIVQDVEDTDFAGQISKSIDALKILIGTTTNFVDSEVYVLTNHLNDTIAEVRAQIASASRGGADSMFGDDSALSKETLKDYRDKLMEALTTAKGKLDDFSDNYLKMLDAAQEKIDEQVSGWESISSHLDHNAKLIQMISGENSYEALNKVYEQQYKNNLNLIATQRTSKEFWQREMAAAQARMATVDKDSKAYKTYAEDYKKASENYKKAVADLDKTVEESLEKLEAQKKNQLDAINHAFDMALSNNTGLEMMEKEWKLVNEQADRYLDNVERALGMEDLNNEFNKVLDTAGLSIKAQQELNKMRDEEIAKLNQKAKISQFDLDEIKARLEIRKQEIALEDAQKNKSNLRLRRDSQGNYSYQYTGDDSKIEEASEGLMSAKREWYELVKKRNIDLSNSILENRKNLQQELQNLETMYFENDEEKRAAQNEIIQKYADIEKDIMADKEEAKKIFFQGTAEYFNDVENNTILPQWQTTVESLVDAWSNGGEDSFIGAVEAGINKIDSVQQQYVDNTHQILNQAGIDYLNMKENGIDPTIESLEELVETNEDLADSLENTSSLLEDQARALEECEDGYNRLKDAAVDAVREAEATLEQLSQTVIRTNQQVQASIESAKNATNLWNTVNSSTNPSSPSNSSNNYLPSQTSSTDNQLKYVVYRNNTNGSVDSSPRTYTNKTDVKKFILDALQHYLMGTVRIYSGNSLVRTLHYGGTYGSREMAYLKSGGYTGTWSGSNHIDDLKSGKLAVLHQKELVLNETDTSNVLDAVHLLRSISVDKIAESIINAARTSASVLNGVGAGMMQGITNLVQNSQANDNSYRNTTINADFSGVRSADAIYEALMELENYNMQQSFT